MAFLRTLSQEASALGGRSRRPKRSANRFHRPSLEPLERRALPSFLSVAPTYPAGGSANAVVMGDFAGDGVNDLVVLNSNGVSFLRGNGDGSFQAPVSFPAGVQPSALAVGDFNGDGKLDLAVGDSNVFRSGVNILLANGDGTFQAPLFAPTAQEPMSVAVGDVNGDGIPDLVTANLLAINQEASVLMGNGDGTTDLAVANATGVTVLLNQPAGPGARSPSHAHGRIPGVKDPTATRPSLSTLPRHPGETRHRPTSIHTPAYAGESRDKAPPRRLSSRGRSRRGTSAPAI